MSEQGIFYAVNGKITAEVAVCVMIAKFIVNCLGIYRPQASG